MSGRERSEAIINTGREWRTVRSVCSRALAVCSASLADEFTQADLDRWTKEYEAVVAKGEKLFHGGLNSKNTVSCDQFHPNASNTHPETYPKLQKQLGKVFEMWEMVNWCIMNPLQSDPLEAGDPKMTALQAYIADERRGPPDAPWGVCEDREGFHYLVRIALCRRRSR